MSSKGENQMEVSTFPQHILNYLPEVKAMLSFILIL